MRDGTLIIDPRSIAIGTMFVMTIVAMIISRRLDKTSKIFDRPVRKSSKIAGSCAGIIKS
jgi:hypothetical protein